MVRFPPCTQHMLTLSKDYLPSLVVSISFYARPTDPFRATFDPAWQTGLRLNSQSIRFFQNHQSIVTQRHHRKSNTTVSLPRSTKKFGPDGRRFEHLSFLNLAQNVVCLVWAVVMLQFSRGGGHRGKGQRSPMTAYWLASISNSFGPACGIQALKYISYPAQVSSPLWNRQQNYALMMSIL